MRFLAILGSFFLLNALFVLPDLSGLGFLNEDTVLISGAVSAVSERGVLPLFTESYGPRVIRPLQLIGMFVEYRLFGLDPYPSQILNLALIAFAQALFFLALAPYAGKIGAIFGAALFAFSLNAAEPRFWLSDRHDLYLLLFFALSLVSTIRYFRMDGMRRCRSLFVLAGVSVALWGGFFSNEKAVAVPPILCLTGCALLAASAWPLRAPAVKRLVLFCSLAGLHLLAYVLFRRAILGEFIGYTGTFLPEGGLSLENLAAWFWGVLAIPFRQPSAAGARMLACAVLPAVLLALAIVCMHARRAGKLPQTLLTIACCVGALYVASIPTLRFNTGVWYESGLNSRLVWLPAVLGSLLLGLLLGRVFRAGIGLAWRLPAVCGFLLLLFASVYAGRIGARNFTRAAAYTREAVQGFSRYCECYHEHFEQVAGLAPYPYGVNTFTEQEWFFAQVKAAGVEHCPQSVSSEAACRIVVDVPGGAPAAAPARISPNLQARFLENVPQDPSLLLSDNFRSLRFEIDAVPSPEAVALGEPIVLSGWAREQKTARAPELLLLLADERVIVATPPNSERDAKVGRKRRDQGAAERYGFALAIDAALIPRGTAALSLVALGRSQARNNAWAARTLARIPLLLLNEGESRD